jgi:hypothetical protein
MPVGGGRLGGEKGVLRLPKRGMAFVMGLGRLELGGPERFEWGAEPGGR